jgi:hypothetical protein
MLVLALAACLAGCGGCPEAARRQLARGDSIMKKALPQAEEVLYELESLFTDYSAGVNTEPQGVWLNMAEYQGVARGLVERSREARAAYEKVLKMKGARPCAEYAGQRLASIEQIERIPGVAEEGFREIKRGDGAQVDQNRLYRVSRSLIQISIEMSYATGYAEVLGSKLKLKRLSQ